LNDVLVTAVKTEDIETFIDIWRGGGIDPHYILMGDASMMHLAGYLLRESTEPFAIVDIGHRFTRVACIEPDPKGAGEGTRLGYARSIQFGGHNLTMAIQSVIGGSYPQAEQYKH